MLDALTVLLAACGVGLAIGLAVPPPAWLLNPTTPAPQVIPVDAPPDTPADAAVPSEEDTVAIPRWVLTQITEHLNRLVVLERRDAMRLVQLEERKASERRHRLKV